MIPYDLNEHDRTRGGIWYACHHTAYRPAALDSGRLSGAISLVSVCATVWVNAPPAATAAGFRRPNLLLLGLLGGSLCMFITMKAIRHKTLHKKFMIGLPLILALQLFLIAALWFLPAFRQA